MFAFSFYSVSFQNLKKKRNACISLKWFVNRTFLSFCCLFRIMATDESHSEMSHLFSFAFFQSPFFRSLSQVKNWSFIVTASARVSMLWINEKVPEHFSHRRLCICFDYISCWFSIANGTMMHGVYVKIQFALQQFINNNKPKAECWIQRDWKKRQPNTHRFLWLSMMRERDAIKRISRKGLRNLQSITGFLARSFCSVHTIYIYIHFGVVVKFVERPTESSTILSMRAHFSALS